MAKGQFINARLSETPVVRYEDMTPLQQAKSDMDFMRHKGGFAYKQAKRRYEKLLRKETTKNGRKPRSNESV